MKLINLLQESLNMIITIETFQGISYKGLVLEIDDYLNIQLKDVDIFNKKDCIYKETVLIRGTSIKYFILPPILAQLNK